MRQLIARFLFILRFLLQVLREQSPINGDGVVDMEDLGLFWQEWLETPFDKRTDLHPDRFADIKDFDILSTYWGVSTDF
jgi:hypothetical protein